MLRVRNDDPGKRPLGCRPSTGLDLNNVKPPPTPRTDDPRKMHPQQNMQFIAGKYSALAQILEIRVPSKCRAEVPGGKTGDVTDSSRVFGTLTGGTISGKYAGRCGIFLEFIEII